MSLLSETVAFQKPISGVLEMSSPCYNGNMLGWLKEDNGTKIPTNFKSYLGCLMIAPAIEILDKALHVDPFMSLGSVTGILIVLAVLSPKATQIGNLAAFSFGWVASIFVTGWTKSSLVVELMSICFVTGFVFWRRWAEVPDDVPETKQS